LIPYCSSVLLVFLGSAVLFLGSGCFEVSNIEQVSNCKGRAGVKREISERSAFVETPPADELGCYRIYFGGVGDESGPWGTACIPGGVSP
jgi:hypothetical protein